MCGLAYNSNHVRSHVATVYSFARLMSNALLSSMAFFHNSRMDELTKILNKLYEDAALEKISEERYQAMAPKYEREQIELRGKRDALTAELARNDEVYNNIQQFIPLIWKYTNIQELTPCILNELIEKIVVHEKEIGADGVKTQQVDIYYKFIGLINQKAEGGCKGEVVKAKRAEIENQPA